MGEAYLAGGRTLATGRDVWEWAREAIERGAGEILLTSMDRDGTRRLRPALTAAVSGAVGVPVIASGGAGELRAPRRRAGPGADAALCASIFHYGRTRSRKPRSTWPHAGIPVRRLRPGGA